KKVAIIGSGNIGTDLMMKIRKQSDHLELVAMAGVDPDSDGLKRAAAEGLAVTHEGLEGLRRMPVYGHVAIVMDATSAKAHAQHHPMLVGDGKYV
ncbi:acetaldehyde dehydrogenase (acetylating), partial [Rhizobiaceae sp. 2RAB30]